MRRLITITGITSFSMIPLVAFAATGTTLDAAVDSWSSVESEHIASEQQDMKDEATESTAELFPFTQSSSSQSPIDQQREERTSAFITVTIDGMPVTFSDVPRDEWFAPYVRDIAEKGIVSGYRDADGKPLGLFGPADHVTIEQLSKVALASSSNVGDCMSNIPMNLTSSGTWSAGYTACAEHLQWTIYADGSIDVHRDATRAEVIVSLLEAFKVTLGDPTGTSFTDVTASTLFNAFIEQAKKDGIVSGYTDKDGNPTGFFGPDDPVTRAEFSKMVTLAMQVYAQK